MDKTEIFLLCINSLIAFCILMMMIKQRKDSRQGTLIGTINLIREMQGQERDKLENSISIAANQKLIQEMPEEAKVKCFSDVERTLSTLHKLNYCYKGLITKLDIELDQKGVLENALEIKKDKDREKTLSLFRTAFKL